jgi:hypothetical protein
MSKKPRPAPTPKQPKPWDPPPPPKTGDPRADITFIAIGRALTAREHFEESMAFLFAKFLGLKGNQLPAKRAYGSILTFRSRAEMVEAAAEAYFFTDPEARLQKEVIGLINAARGFAPRRNEIAHGIVRRRTVPGGFIASPSGRVVQKLETWGFAVVPSDYSTKRTTLEPPTILLAGIGHGPDYIYTSKEINDLTKKFTTLATQTDAIAHQFFCIPCRPRLTHRATW